MYFWSEQGPRGHIFLKHSLPLHAFVSENKNTGYVYGNENSYSEMHLIPEGLFTDMNYLFSTIQVDFFWLHETVIEFYAFL